ncbi:predicted protein [Thalassiosira pseudonana CCMP1335]|uniref:Uncharacterized protein n=1 Tax=Thalassiosira pseudonana TaxID=35128 RepID=B8BYK3_THAPS|nr:predicted protein [Thalassiosira pseudonana CCMP1335]EED94389.1 predicted protein [Thalassiosira pseudonana CCMP1335]
MRISLAILCLVLGGSEVALARSSGRPSSSSAARRGGGSSSRGGGSSRPSSSSSSGSKRRRDPIDDYEEEEDIVVGFDLEEDIIDDGGDGDDYDDYSDEDVASSPRGRSRGPPPSSRGGRPPAAGAGRRRPTPRDEYDEYDEDEFAPRGSGRGASSRPSGPSQRGGSRRGPPPSRGGRPGENRMVSYNNRGGRRGPPPPPVPSTFTRGLSAIRDRMPDPNTVKETMLSAANAAQEKTSQFSSNIYREVKGLTSSELEQVMLKATRPDETPVKTKHVERLVGVTYQISGKYDIYDAVLRKLWNKMAEKDIRTKLKSVAFLSRYAHYVLTRAQTFGGVFNEISLAGMPPPPTPPSKKSRSKRGAAAVATKPKNPPLCEEHLKFAQMVLKAGLACTLHDGEESESTAMCVERVAADLMGLTAAVAIALKRELKQTNIDDKALVKQWCEFYSEELLPDTKKFVKKTSSKLDAYGLYLPSRMSASLPQELLEKGLKLDGGDDAAEDEEKKEAAEDDGEEKEKTVAEVCESTEGKTDATDAEGGDVSATKDEETQADEEDEYDEYYDEYDEYDD